MAEPLLSVIGLVKRFGGLIATNGLDLNVARGETHALIGPNGAGKTTLVGQLQGEITPDAGRILFAGREVTYEPAHRRAAHGIARSFQISSVFPDFTASANVGMAVQARLGHSFRFFRPTQEDAAIIQPALEALALIGLDHRAHVLARDLSHGERRQLELAMALAMRPMLLLLDEPLAGMGRQDGERMTTILGGLKQHYTILLIEHDMDAVFALADRVSVLVSGRAIATGSPADIRADPEVRSAYLGGKH
ncbi:MAG: ABC transporter ATP-binding protein [Bradyrhizobium sp.]